MVILCFLVVFFILEGCVFDVMPVMMLVVPILLPTFIALGYNLIWFCIILVILIELGVITPPIGMNVFFIAGIAPDVPVWTIYRGIWPFVGADLLCLVLIVYFPQIALWLAGGG